MQNQHTETSRGNEREREREGLKNYELDTVKVLWIDLDFFV